MASGLKLDVLIANFPYGGNGGVSSEHPNVRHWYCRTLPKILADERIGRVEAPDYSDTPIPMTRNRAVREARERGFDVLLMIDSDMKPDSRLGLERGAKPFWDEAFDFLYDHYPKGPVVIGAPYVGPSPVQNVYVFRWATSKSNNPSDSYIKLDAYSREEAERMSGIQPCAALPTGFILCDVRAFELTAPVPESKTQTLLKFQAGEFDVQECLRRLEPGWFYYEWTDGYASEKASTEDVTATRDISMLGELTLGYNPVFCAWDSWAGHWKPELCDKPVVLRSDQVARRFADAAERSSTTRKQIEVRTKGAADRDWSRAFDATPKLTARDGEC